MQKIRDRHGKLIPFELGKITGSILDAIRRAGYHDEWVAEKIAPVVEFTLARNFGDEPASVEDVVHFVEQSLRSIEGLSEVATAYIENIQRKRRIEEIEERAPAPAGAIDVRVAPLTSSEQFVWNRVRLEEALVREHDLGVVQARDVAGAVESRVRALNLKHISTGLIRELVDNELLSRGLRSGELGASQLQLPLYDIDQALFPVSDATADSSIDTATDLNAFVASSLLEQYALAKVYSPESAAAHRGGRIELGELSAPAQYESIRVDLRGLLEQGAGLGLDRFMPDRCATLDAALARCATLVAALGELCSARLELLHIDTALASVCQGNADAVDAARALGDRLDIARRNRRIVLGLDALGGQTHYPGSIALVRGLLQAHGDGARRSRLAYDLCLRVGAATAGDPQAYTLLERAAARALGEGGIEFSFVHSRSELEARNLFGMSLEREVSLEREGGMSAQAGMVTLNLLAPALGEDGERGDYFAHLDVSIRLAVSALSERAAFTRRFHTRWRSSQPGLASMLGHRLAQAPAYGRIDVVGLREVAELLAGNGAASGKATTDARVRCAQQVLAYVAFKVNALAEDKGLVVNIGGRASLEAARRAWRIDRRSHAAALDRLFPDGLQAYSQGLEGVSGARDWMQRLEDDAALHALGRDAALCLRPGGDHIGHGALVQTLLKLAAQQSSRASGLRVEVTLQTCRLCGNTAPPATSICPACGSEDWMAPRGQKTLFDQPRESDPTPRSSYTVF